MTAEWLRLVVGGLIIGLIVAAPVGAVNVICIRRTLSFGPLNGFLSGLGAAAGDGAFAIVAAFGLSAVSETVMRYQGIMQTVGGLFLIGLGVHTYISDPERNTKTNAKGAAVNGTDDLPHTIVSTFFLTITNPATLLAFTAIIAGATDGLGYTHSASSAAILAVAVIAGSALWWFLLTLLIGLLHGQISTRWLRRINHIAGGVIATIGLGLLIAQIV